MQCTVIRFDATHELAFGRPTFAFAEPLRLVKVFYETISPRFPIATEHLAVVPSNILSEVQIRIGLFNNVAPLELRSDKMTLRFPTIGRTDVALVKDATILAHEALSKAIPDVVRGVATISTFNWLKLSGGTEATRLFFQDRATPKMSVDAKEFGADSWSPHVKGTLRNEADKWEISIRVEPSVVPNSDLFLGAVVSFYPGTPYAAIPEQIEFVEKTTTKLWHFFGLEVEGASS